MTNQRNREVIIHAILVGQNHYFPLQKWWRLFLGRLFLKRFHFIWPLEQCYFQTNAILPWHKPISATEMMIGDEKLEEYKWTQGKTQLHWNLFKVGQSLWCWPQYVERERIRSMTQCNGALSQICNVKLSSSTCWRQHVSNGTGKGLCCHRSIEYFDTPPIKGAWDVQWGILSLSFYHCRCSSSHDSLKGVWLTLRCWGNSSIPEGRFSKWF